MTAYSSPLPEHPLPLQENVREAADVLADLANAQRLQILCSLVQHGELCVGEIHERVDLSQSALSQHLARLRQKGIVTARKEGLSVFYQIARQDVRQILETLHELYCAPPPGVSLTEITTERTHP